MEWDFKMREGDFMTRICAVANQKELVVSSDTMFINTFTKQTSFNNIKLIQNENMIIGLLGAQELITNSGTIKISEIAQEILNTNSNPYEIFNILKNKLTEIWTLYRFSSHIQVVFFWKLKNDFYTFAFELKFFQELGHVTIIYPFGEINEENYMKYNFTNYILDCGEGVKGGLIIQPYHSSNPRKTTETIITQAIHDNSLSTVGGYCYTLKLAL